MLLLHAVGEGAIHALRTVRQRSVGTELVREVELAIDKSGPPPNVVLVVRPHARVRLCLFTDEEREFLTVLGAKLVHVKIVPGGVGEGSVSHCSRCAVLEGGAERTV